MKRILLIVLLATLSLYSVSYAQDEEVVKEVPLRVELTDGDQEIAIYHAGPELDNLKDEISLLRDEISELKQLMTIQPTPEPTVDESLKVNLNTGSLIELMSLDGIGKAKAERIIASREADGPFASWTDVMDRRVGIGPETFKDLEDQGLAYIE